MDTFKDSYTDQYCMSIRVSYKDYMKNSDLFGEPVKLESVYMGFKDKNTRKFICRLSTFGINSECKVVPVEFYTFSYFQGIGITTWPDIDTVLSCLFLDSGCVENGFSEFCSDFGYDSDSIKARKVYGKCLKTRKALKRLFKDTYESMSEIVSEF